MNFDVILSDPDRAEVERLLAEARGESDFTLRIARFSASFLGRPYFASPLGGGPGLPENLTLTLAGFDCVTYIETVLALADSATADEFIEAARRLRYEHGEVAWTTRNHYMVDWAARNEAQGLVIDLTTGPDTVTERRELAVVEGIPPKTVEVRYYPKNNLSQVAEWFQTGDLIFFASTKRDLDVFHTGLLVRRGDRDLMRHATRQAGEVVEQPLSDFANHNLMAGAILLRPAECGKRGRSAEAQL